MNYKYSVFVIFVIHVVGVSQSITIDSQLIQAKKDCYGRVAVGERLPFSDTVRRVDTPALSKCERECTADEERCLSFSFGISPTGNGTCELSIRENLSYDERIVDAITDPDFDVYAKRTDCDDDDENLRDPLVSPRPDRDSIFDYQPNYDDSNNGDRLNDGENNGSPPRDRPPGGSSQPSSYDRPSNGNSRPSNDRPSDGNGRPSYDRPQSGSSSHDRPSNGNSRPSYDRPQSGSSTSDRPSNGNSRPSYDRPQSGSSSNDRPSSGNSRPSYDRPPSSSSSSYDRPSNKPSYDRPQSGGSSSHDRPYSGSRPSYDRPQSSSSGSSYDKPQSSSYDRPQSSRPSRPNSDPDSYYSGSSSRPTNADDGYGGNKRPSGGSGYDDNYNKRPYGGSSANSRPYGSGSNTPYQSNTNNRPYSNSDSSSVNKKPYGGSSRPQYDNNRPYSQHEYSSSSSSGSSSNSYSQSSNGVVQNSNSYGSSNSNSHGSSSYYGYRPSNSYDTRPNYYDNNGKDKYYTYASTSAQSDDRFHWSQSQNPYTQNGVDKYPNSYGEKYPYKNSKNPEYYGEIPYRRPIDRYNIERRPYDENEIRRPYDFDNPDRPYGGGYGDYRPNKYHDRPIGPERPLYVNLDYERPYFRPEYDDRPAHQGSGYGGSYNYDTVAQVYGQEIAVSHGSGLGYLDKGYDKNKGSHYGTAQDDTYRPIRPISGYRGNGYDNLSPSYGSDYGNYKPYDDRYYDRYSSRPQSGYDSGKYVGANGEIHRYGDRPNRPHADNERPDDYYDRYDKRPAYGSYYSESSADRYESNWSNSYGSVNKYGDSGRPNYYHDKNPSYNDNKYKLSYDSQFRPKGESGYGGTNSYSDRDRPSSGYDTPDPGYGSTGNRFDDDRHKPSYGSGDRPASSYEGPQQRPIKDKGDSGYNNQRPSYDRPYGDVTKRPSYQNEVTSGYGNQGFNDNKDRPDPAYEDRPGYEQSDSGGGYGKNKEQQGSKGDADYRRPVGPPKKNGYGTVTEIPGGNKDRFGNYWIGK